MHNASQAGGGSADVASMATINGNIQVLSLTPARTRGGYLFTASVVVGSVPKTITMQVADSEIGRDGRRRFVPLSRAREIAAQALAKVARGSDV